MMYELRLSSKDLHFAAYVKAGGIPLDRIENGMFVFLLDSAQQATKLRVEHSNSEALKVDRELLCLKKFL